MKILLTGATGYIAQRLLPKLLQDGHEVVCCVRDKNRFNNKPYGKFPVKVLEMDFLSKESVSKIPADIDAAYYLIHSMASSSGDFTHLEALSARNFVEAISCTRARQV